MSKQRAVLALLMLTGLALLLGGCSALRAPQENTAAADNARKAAAAGDDARASRLYAQAAASAATPQKRNRLRLAAALAALDANDSARARTTIGPLAGAALTQTNQALLELAQTRLRVAGRSRQAQLDALPQAQADTPDAAAAAIWAARARAQFDLDRPVAGLHALVKRSERLQQASARRANNRQILKRARATVRAGTAAQSEAASQSDAVTRGWLSLAAIGERVYPSPEARKNALSNWYARHPDHPASATVLAQQFGFGAADQASARRLGQTGAGVAAPASQSVALAVPLSGRYKSAGSAVRDGLLFAYGLNNNGAERPVIWDSAKQGVDALARRARQQDIGVLVGPLRKPKVTALGKRFGGVITIALNHATAPVQRNDFFQFGLAPEDDARAAAARSLAQGFRRALVLVPKNERGQRLASAFGERLSAGGGAVVAQAGYAPGGHDHSGPIRTLVDRYQASGADFIFVAATPTQGRLIHSQLRYYHASDLPMVATSLIYAGQPQPKKDIDLNGVYFVDLPWVLGQGQTITRRRKAARAEFGATATTYQRLFALGMDAWLLGHQVAMSGLEPGTTFQGMTGLLALDASGEIQRNLAWAVFRRGRPKLIAMPTPAPAPGSAPRAEPDAASTPAKAAGAKPSSKAAAGHGG